MKKIQKEYQRKLKVNQNNDIFTTFQRYSRQPMPNPTHHSQSNSAHPHSQHQNIQSLKTTLKELVPVSMQLTKQFSRVGVHLMSEQRSQISEQYMHKLDKLTKNLQEIAGKGHFNLGKQDTGAVRDKKSRTVYEQSQTISRWEPVSTQQFVRHPNNSTSTQLPISRNHSFLEGRGRSNSKSVKRHDASVRQMKIQRSSSKKHIVQGMGKKSNSKNLAQIFQSLESNNNILRKDRHNDVLRKDRQVKRNQTIFKRQVHRHKITSILVSDQIYTGSLDYSVKRMCQKQGQFMFESLGHFRSGIQFMNTIGSIVFVASRDGFLRSLPGDYFYRWNNTPLSFSQSQNQGQLNIAFSNNQLKLFDLQKRAVICHLKFDDEFTLMSKVNRQTFVGKGASLFGVDWRKRDYLVNLWKDRDRNQEYKWMSDPNSKAIWCSNGKQLTILSHDHRKIRSKNIPHQYSVKTHCWFKNQLYMLLAGEQERQKVFRCDQHKDWQEIDTLNEIDEVNRMLVRDRQIYYGSKQGIILVKSYGNK